jgi:hypothetical protein
LFIIAGREKLRWEHDSEAWKDVILEVSLPDLGVAEVAELLDRRGVSDPTARISITNAARGHAFSINLLIRIFEVVKAEDRIPTTADFPQVQEEILDRLLSHLDPHLVKLLRIASFQKRSMQDFGATFKAPLTRSGHTTSMTFAKRFSSARPPTAVSDCTML